jgi:hypothetical protein
VFDEHSVGLAVDQHEPPQNQSLLVENFYPFDEPVFVNSLCKTGVKNIQNCNALPTK